MKKVHTLRHAANEFLCEFYFPEIKHGRECEAKHDLYKGIINIFKVDNFLWSCVFLSLSPPLLMALAHIFQTEISQFVEIKFAFGHSYFLSKNNNIIYPRFTKATLHYAS